MGKIKLRHFFNVEEIQKVRIFIGLPTELRPTRKTFFDDPWSGGKWSEIWLVDRYGEKIARVGLIQKPHDQRSWWKRTILSGPIFDPLETVLEALERIYDPLGESVSFVVDIGNKAVWNVPRNILAKYLK